jgi:AraC-like DNA-binding protein
MLQSLDIVQSLIVSFAAPDSIMQKLYRLTAIAETADPMKSILCSSIIYDLILDMHRCGGLLDSRSKQQYFEQLAPVLRYVEDQYYEPITLDLLASKLSVTPRHTCTLFQTALGLRPFEYVTMIRLRKAKELLMRRQELDVNEVARLVGYEHPSYFIRIFRKSEGVTPGQFRKSR